MGPGRVSRFVLVVKVEVSSRLSPRWASLSSKGMTLGALDKRRHGVEAAMTFTWRATLTKVHPLIPSGGFSPSVALTYHRHRLRTSDIDGQSVHGVLCHDEMVLGGII